MIFVKIFFLHFSEGSEEEIELTDLPGRNSMERTLPVPMVPPQSEVLNLYTNNNSNNQSGDLQLANNKLTVKPAEELYESKRHNNSNNSSGDESDDRLIASVKTDLMYIRAREIILAQQNVLPSELELRAQGVFARIPINKGVRYGPFQGKWATCPEDTRFAWEVSDIATFNKF